MGSFNSQCAITGLPITGGTPIRFLLLTQNPFNDEWVKCHAHSLWVPRTFPLKAKYDDYGSAESLEAGYELGLWFEGLRRDLVECGTGDNTFHDLAVSKDMPLEEFLEALLKERVRVQRRSAHVETDFMAVVAEKMRAKLEEIGAKPYVPAPVFVPQVDPGFPTLQSIEALLKDAGLAGYIVDEQAWGSVRIRWDKYGGEYGNDATRLKAVTPLLKDYSYMICAGSGSYPNDAEIVVRPKPGKGTVHFSDDEEGSLLVKGAMVREDVWQLLLKIPMGFYDYKKHEDVPVTLKQYKAGLRGFMAYRKEQLAKIDDMCFDDFDPMLLAQFPGSRVVQKGQVPAILSLADHWQLALAKGPLPKEFIDTVAEFAYVQDVLDGLGYWWKPSYSIGGQDPEWDLKAAFHAKLAKLVKGILVKGLEEANG